jgi:hypothetical protein
MKKENYIEREAKKAVKRLWPNLESVGVKESTDNNIIFTPDQLNDFFAYHHRVLLPLQ